MRVTSLGHAALYIETADQCVLIDPVFADSLAAGALVYHPARRLDFARLPEATALVVTHGHFDHFHAPSLARLSKALPVFVPNDPELLEGLASLGFENVTVVAPWQTLELGRTRLVPTPSEHEEPEFGVFMSDGESSFWHMADSEVSLDDGRRLLREQGRIDVVSVKYQPVVRASMGYLRGAGPRFDKREVVTWLETACAVEPRFAFPFASGLRFAGRHAWFNRYALPLSAAEAAHLLERRLGSGRAGVLAPGDAVEARPSAHPLLRQQVSAFVSSVASPEVSWEPVDTTTLLGLESAVERAALDERLTVFMDERLAPWLRAELARGDSPWQLRRLRQVVWQLVVEAGSGERIEWHLDFSQEPLVLARGRHPHANAFTHVAGRGLDEVLRGVAPGVLFWLAGEARSYEKVIRVEAGTLVADADPPPEDEAADPLTYFLRRFGPQSDGAPTPSLAMPQRPEELEMLGRSGENAGVAHKKALLSFLACRELERRGVPLRDEAVQATSDSFRRAFGLGEPEQTLASLQAAGLKLESYTRVMRGFTAVQLIQELCATEMADLVDAHARVATMGSRRT